MIMIWQPCYIQHQQRLLLTTGKNEKRLRFAATLSELISIDRKNELKLQRYLIMFIENEMILFMKGYCHFMSIVKMRIVILK